MCYLVSQVLISIEVTRALLNYKEFSLIPKQENSKKNYIYMWKSGDVVMLMQTLYIYKPLI
jgi:hypothetical protein